MSPYGFPPPPEILALKPGRIFSLDVSLAYTHTHTHASLPCTSPASLYVYLICSL